MTGTYEMIRDLPGKGTNWPRLLDALTNHYVATYAATHNGAKPWAPNSLDLWAAAKGIRQMRLACMEAANFAVGNACLRSSRAAPSEETLSWGGFLGGETLVWTDKEAEARAVDEIAAIIAVNR